MIDTSADEYNNSVGISLSAAQPDPDVIWVKDMGALLQMADKEQLLPLDDFIKKDNLDLSVYKGAAEQLRYNDISYSLPYRATRLAKAIIRPNNACLMRQAWSTRPMT